MDGRWSFYVYRRASGIHYAEFHDETGARIASRSTKKRKHTEAVIIAHDWAEHGLPGKNGRRRSLPELRPTLDLLHAIRETDLTQSNALRLSLIKPWLFLNSPEVVKLV